MTDTKTVDFYSEPGPLTGKRVRITVSGFALEGFQPASVPLGMVGMVGDYADFKAYSIKWDDGGYSWMSGEEVEKLCEVIG